MATIGSITSGLGTSSSVEVGQPRQIGPKTDGATTIGTSAAADSRLAGSGPRLFSFNFTDGERTPAALRERLSDELGKIFGAIDRKAGDASTEAALDSLGDLVRRAAADPGVTGIEIRISNVSRLFRNQDGAGEVYSSVSQFAVEVGIARAGKVAAGDVELLGFDGKRLSLSAAEKRTGIANGTYRIEDGAAKDGAVRKVQDDATKQALERLRLVSDALAAFRRGDTEPLQRIETLLRGGTLNAEAVRALSSAKDVTQAKVFPGSGIIEA